MDLTYKDIFIKIYKDIWKIFKGFFILGWLLSEKLLGDDKDKRKGKNKK